MQKNIKDFFINNRLTKLATCSTTFETDCNIAFTPTAFSLSFTKSYSKMSDSNKQAEAMQAEAELVPTVMVGNSKFYVLTKEQMLELVKEVKEQCGIEGNFGDIRFGPLLSVPETLKNLGLEISYQGINVGYEGGRTYFGFYLEDGAFYCEPGDDVGEAMRNAPCFKNWRKDRLKNPLSSKQV